MSSRLRHSKPYRIALLLLTVTVAACLVAVPDRAQIRVSTSLVMVDATVKAKNGKVMDDLKQNDFIVSEDGVPQKLQIFGRDTLPLDLILLLDTSASTGGVLQALQYAAAHGLTALKAEDEVALMTFSSEAVLRVPFDKNKIQSTAEIAALQTGGTTNINDALYVSASYLRSNAPPGRRVIVLISDDVATDAGKYNTLEIIKEAITADTAIYNLKLPDHNSAETHLAASHTPGLVDLRKVMEETGGESFEVKDVLRLDTIFRALIERIKTRYTLGYYVNGDQARGKEHKLEVHLAPSFGTKGKNYLLLAKSGYIMP